MNFDGWNFERVENKYPELPVGKYRLRIKSAEKAISKSSKNDMLVIVFEVSGSKKTLMHHIVFLPDKPEITNRMLTQFFDSFGIEGDFNLASWTGKVGGCQTKMETYDGVDRARISYFLSKRQQEELPAWQSADNGGTKWVEISAEEELPFF